MQPHLPLARLFIAPREYSCKRQTSVDRVGRRPQTARASGEKPAPKFRWFAVDCARMADALTHNADLPGHKFVITQPKQFALAGFT